MSVNRHTDESVSRAVRGAKAAGHSVDLILDLLSDASLTIEEAQSIRGAVHEASLRLAGDDVAWIRTPWAKSSGTTLHAWTREGREWHQADEKSPRVWPFCGDVMGREARQLAIEHSSRMKTLAHRCYQCKQCEVVLRREQYAPLSLNEVYKLASMELVTPEDRQ